MICVILTFGTTIWQKWRILDFSFLSIAREELIIDVYRYLNTSFLPYCDIISIHTDAAIDQLNLALDQFLQFKNGIPISCGSRCLQLFLNKTPGKF